MVQLQIKVLKDEWTPMMRKLSSTKVNETLSNAGFDIAKVTSRLLKRTAKSHAWKSASDIKPGRKGYNSHVTVPKKLIYLDSMQPHYVALKRGRNITKWTKQHMPLKRRNGRSKVFVGPRGGIKGGYLYVSPIHWIKKPMQRGLKQTRRIIIKHVNELLKKGA